MANYVVKIYNQTGFDTCNVPDSPRMIESNFTPYKEYTTFELVQGRYLATLRVQLTAIEANKIDLVTVSSDLINDTTVYTVDGYNMCAPDVCEFTLLLEPYSTLGGFGYDSGNNVLNGSIKRCHVSVEEDNKNFYTLPEPFENREPIEWSVQRLMAETENPLTLVETLSIPSQLMKKDALCQLVGEGKVDVAGLSNSNCSRMGAVTGIFVGYDEKNSNSFVYQYMETVSARNLKSTILKVEDQDITLGTRWWNADNINYEVTISHLEYKTVKDDKVLKGSLISDLVSDGRAGDVTAIWEVPRKFLMLGTTKLDYDPSEEDNYGGVDEAKSNSVSGSIALTKWATTTYNNKINYGQDLMVRVYCPASGSSSEHQVTEIMTPNSAAEWISSVPFTIMADVRPTGSPIFMFNYLNKSNNLDNMIEVVKGGQWRQVALTDVGTANKLDVMKNEHREELYNYDRATQRINNFVANVSDALNIAGNLKLAFTGGGNESIVPYGLNIYNRQRQVWRNNLVNQQQNQELSSKAAMASVNISRESTSFANDRNKNTFFAIVSHFSNNDLMAFDTFLTRYGYNVGNMPFEEMQTAFYNRPSYNFVQVNDMTVESVTGNVNLVNDAVERLKQGLRIWHVKPNAKDMLAGGNR